MKGKLRKILGVGLALALVLSFSLVAAVPTAADSDRTGMSTWFACDDAGDVEWVAGQTHTGDYTPKMTYVSGDYGMVYFVPDGGTTVSDLDDITNSPEWSYWYALENAGHGVELELRFTSADYNPTTGAGSVEITVFSGFSSFLDSDTWHKQAVLASSGACVYYGYDPTDGTWFDYESGTFPTLEEVEDLINLEPEMVAAGDSASNWELTRVGMQLCTAKYAYVDEVTIAGTTYDLEPILLDAEYYSVGDTVEVTVPNFTANTDTIRVNPVTGEPIVDADYENNWSFTATSTSDTSGITVDLEETGINTGIFRGSFPTTSDESPPEDELYIQDADTITVTYGTIDTPTAGIDRLGANWGAGVQDPSTSIDALVDDTAPTITVVFPEDGKQIVTTTPEIEATYEDVPDISGIDEDSVEMFFDGVDVTDDDATTVGASSVTYTPTDDLTDGSYDVTVNVSDNAGNEATEIWSFRVVSWLVEPESVADDDELDALDTVGVAVSITGDTGAITVGRYASNPEPEAALTFSLIENGFFDVQVLNAENATQIVLKFADPEITADSVAYFWDDVKQEWIACSDQGTTVDYLWVKVRDDTKPNIAELEGTPFGISEVAEVDILAYYRGLGEDPNVVETTDLLQAGNDWANEVVPSGFTEPISTTQLLALANEWAATD